MPFSSTHSEEKNIEVAMFRYWVLEGSSPKHSRILRWLHQKIEQDKPWIIVVITPIFELICSWLHSMCRWHDPSPSMTIWWWMWTTYLKLSRKLSSSPHLVNEVQILLIFQRTFNNKWLSLYGIILAAEIKLIKEVGATLHPFPLL